MNDSINSIDLKPPLRSLIKFEDEYHENESTAYNTGESNSLAVQVTVVKEEYIEQNEDDIKNENDDFNNANDKKITFEINHVVGKEFFVKEEYIIDDVAKEAAINEYVCKFCSRIFNDWKTLLKHNLIHLTLQLKKCDQSQSEKTSKTKKPTQTLLEQNSKGQWQCIVCSKIHNQYQRLLNHVTEVHTAYYFVCEYCQRLFHTKRVMENHIKFVHKKEKKNYLTKSESPCLQCNAVLDTKHALKTHMRTVHSATSFECDICGLQYKCFPYLQTHKRRVHKETGLFTCDTCSKQFKSRRRLLIHIRRPHVLFDRQKSRGKSVRRRRKRVKTVVEEKDSSAQTHKASSDQVASSAECGGGSTVN